MQYITAIAVFAYFLFALASILDKHIVSNTSLKPVAYAFYSGFFQLFYALAIPVVAFLVPSIHFSFPSPIMSLWGVFDGIVFVFGLVALYKATEAGEISRVSPIVGVLVTIFTFFLSFLFLDEALSLNQTLAFLLFISGGFLMSAKFVKGGIQYIKGANYVIMAGFLFALYYVIMDYLFDHAGFVESFTVIQFGGFVGSLLLIVRKKDRQSVFKKEKKSKIKFHGHDLIIFLANKIFSAVGALLLNFAIAIGSVTMVNSLQVVQYAFVLIITMMLSRKAPHLFDEETHHSVILQKGIALALTTIGVLLIA
jgi:drug/metabolite transporter (DMT)-like permease